jgi:hypothetical protein
MESLLNEKTDSSVMHQLLEQQLKECTLLSPGGNKNWAGLALALAARPLKLCRLLEMVSQAYSENDLYLDRTMGVLDKVCDEARDLHRMEHAHRLLLEEALAAGETGSLSARPV